MCNKINVLDQIENLDHVDYSNSHPDLVVQSTFPIELPVKLNQAVQNNRKG